MKTWETPEIKEIALACTEYGGTPSSDLDNTYFDQNGALHVNFEPIHSYS